MAAVRGGVDRGSPATYRVIGGRLRGRTRRNDDGLPGRPVSRAAWQAVSKALSSVQARCTCTCAAGRIRWLGLRDYEQAGRPIATAQQIRQVQDPGASTACSRTSRHTTGIGSSTWLPSHTNWRADSPTLSHAPAGPPGALPPMPGVVLCWSAASLLGLAGWAKTAGAAGTLHRVNDDGPCRGIDGTSVQREDGQGQDNKGAHEETSASCKASILDVGTQALVRRAATALLTPSIAGANGAGTASSQSRERHMPCSMHRRPQPRCNVEGQHENTACDHSGRRRVR